MDLPLESFFSGRFATRFVPIMGSFRILFLLVHTSTSASLSHLCLIVILVLSLLPRYLSHTIDFDNRVNTRIVLSISQSLILVLRRATEIGWPRILLNCVWPSIQELRWLNVILTFSTWRLFHISGSPWTLPFFSIYLYPAVWTRSEDLMFYSTL